MASADYHSCDHCGSRKTFYDAEMNYKFTADGQILYDGHRVVSLCDECATTHEIKIVPLAQPPAGRVDP